MEHDLYHSWAWVLTVALILGDSAEETQSSESRSSNSAPPKKKSRLMGDLELDSSEVQRLLEARSKYDGQLTEVSSTKLISC